MLSGISSEVIYLCLARFSYDNFIFEMMYVPYTNNLQTQKKNLWEIMTSMTRVETMPTPVFCKLLIVLIYKISNLKDKFLKETQVGPLNSCSTVGFFNA